MEPEMNDVLRGGGTGPIVILYEFPTITAWLSCMEIVKSYVPGVVGMPTIPNDASASPGGRRPALIQALEIPVQAET
jgi:hypothetical protein